MKNIYKSILVALVMVMVFFNANAQQTVTIGTGTVATTTAGPYFDDWTSQHCQIIYLASELQALGLSGATDLATLEFNIQAISTSLICSGLSLGEVRNFAIRLKNTTEANTSTTIFDNTGTTLVYYRSSWQAKTGWNTHNLDQTFNWDGVSNLLVDICHDNSVVATTCYNCCNYYYYNAPTGNMMRYAYADGAGSLCAGTGPTVYAISSIRPDIRITTAPPANPTPPVPNFQFTLGTDTLWVMANSTLINTSSNSSKNYWNITQYSPTTKNGPFSAFTPSTPLQCNIWGCWIDTANNDPNLNYYFPSRGFYKVMLMTVNKYGSNFIEKTVYVDSPRTKPPASFYAVRRQLGANDRIRINNLSTNAPARVKWWLVNNCTTCPADTNRFLPNDSAFSPVLAAYTPGTYKLCLAVSNIKGADTICKSDYMKIWPGYMMYHSEPGRFDSVGFADQGYLYSDIRTSAGVNMSGQFQPTNPSPNGFRIAPCADTIYLTLERLRMRNPGSVQGDSVYVRLNGYTGPIVRRWGGNNISVLKDTTKVYKYAGQQIFIQYVPAPTVPLVSIVSDSGFTLKWTSSPATYPKPVAAFTCPDTLYTGYKVRFINASTGQRMAYAWDLNNDGAFGQDKPLVGIDSITQNPTITFNAGFPTTRKICLKTANCAGNDTFCRTLPLYPITAPPTADFTTSRSTGFITDTFQFINKSQNGSLSWRWRFDPNNVTYLNGTDSTSEFPYVSLNSPQYYNVTLVATNPLGTSFITKNQIVNAIDYGSPGSGFPAELASGDFGISRVRIAGADVTLDTTTNLKLPRYTRLNADMKTTVYRGGQYRVDVYRITANNAERLRIWADYNRDADYLDEGEQIYAEDLTNNVKSGTPFIVPANAVIGNSRMLIGACDSVSVISSTNATIGVYEDYGLIIGRDFTKPVVTLVGPVNDVTEINKPYADLGAVVVDNIQGASNVPNARIALQTSTNLNRFALGTYVMKYFATDMYGNTSDTVYRNVQVVLNSTGPKISILGPDTDRVEVGSGTYFDPGYTAISNIGDTLTGQVQITGIPNTNVLGVTLRTYTIFDAYGLKATTKRVIIVRDTQKPVVSTFSGKNTVSHQIGTAYDDTKYIQVTDNYWTDIAPVRKGNINSNVAGIYMLLYTATDGSGNVSDVDTVYVTVLNKVHPTINLVGSAVVVVPVLQGYNDLGVVAKDYKGSLLAYSSNMNDVLKLDSIGDYIIIYTATDEFGESVSTKRTVKVRDLESPVIELLGDNPVLLPLCNNYGDPGVKVSDNFDKTELVFADKNDNVGIQVTIDASKVNRCGGGYYYTVYINATDHAGNKAEEKKRLVYVSLVGLADVSKPVGFDLYPNPATNVLNVALTSGEMESITAFDAQGRAIALNPIKDGKQYKMDISQLGSGIYLISIMTKDGSNFSGKFTVAGK